MATVRDSLSGLRLVERELEVLAAGAASLLRRPPGREDRARLEEALICMLPAQDRLRAAARALARTGLAQNARAAESRLRLWPEVRALALRLTDPRNPAPILPERQPGSTALAQAGLAADLYSRLHRHLGGTSHGPEPALYHPDIPLPLDALTALFLAARRLCLAQDRAAGLRFLDVGCGIGTTLLIAARLFDQVEGLDTAPRALTQARRLTRGEARITLHRADALDWDGYGRFDVIYWFQPIRDEALMARLEDRIAAAARPGTVLVAPGTLLAPRAARLRLGRVAPDLFIAGRSQAGARALRSIALWIGSDLPPVTAPPPSQGWLAPLISRCRSFGFELPRRAPFAP